MFKNVFRWIQTLTWKVSCDWVILWLTMSWMRVTVLEIHSFSLLNCDHVKQYHSLKIKVLQLETVQIYLTMRTSLSTRHSLETFSSTYRESHSDQGFEAYNLSAWCWHKVYCGINATHAFFMTWHVYFQDNKVRGEL